MYEGKTGTLRFPAGQSSGQCIPVSNLPDDLFNELQENLSPVRKHGPKPRMAPLPAVEDHPQLQRVEEPRTPLDP